MASSKQKTVAYEGLTISYTTHNLPPPPNKPVLNLHPRLVLLQRTLVRPISPLHFPSQHYPRPPRLWSKLETGKPESVDYNCDFLARSITAILDAETIQSVVLIGHSLGGFLATTLLRLLGEDRVKGIVYVHSFWLMPAHYLTVPERAAWMEALKSDENMWSMFETAFTHAKSSDQTVEKVRKVMVEETPLYVRLNSGCTDALPPHWRWEEVFAKTPMLHITSKDGYPWDEQCRHHLPNLKVEVWDGVSIFLHMDAPQRFNERVEQFLEENSLV